MIDLDLQLALWVDHTDPLGLLIGAGGEEQDVLVDEHAQGDERHVEPVQEVLDRDVHVGLHVLLVVEVEDTLGLCGNNAFFGKRKSECYLGHLPDHVLVVLLHRLKSATEVSQRLFVQFCRVKEKQLLETATEELLHTRRVIKKSNWTERE